MSICVIPARGGSKRIPRKNVRFFSGRPMIGWSISAAAASGCFKRIIVSTEDSEIAETARALGAEVPYIRKSELADDHTPTLPVVADAVTRLEVQPCEPVCCLYATAPFVRSQDICAGLSLLQETSARFVVSITTFEFPIQRALRRSHEGWVEMIHPESANARSQDLEEAWHDAGQFYWAYAATWQDQGTSIFGAGTYGLVLPRYRVQDIDTEEDWRRAERLMIAGSSAP